MVKIETYDYRASNERNFALKNMLVKGLALVFTGTNSVGQTLTRANLGTLQLYKNNILTWEVSLERMWGYVDKLFPFPEFGKQQFSSTTGGAIEAIFVFPTYLPGVRGAHRFTQNDSITLTHSSLTSIVDSITVDVFGIPALLPEVVFPHYRNYTITADSGLVEPKPIQGKQNIAVITVDYSANHSRFRLAKGSKLIYDVTLNEAHLQRGLEIRDESFADADSNFNPHIFSFIKDGHEQAFGRDYAISVQSTDATFSGLIVEMNESSARQIDTGENFAQSIRRNKSRSQ